MNEIALFALAGQFTTTHTYRGRGRSQQIFAKTPLMLQNITDINNSNVISVVTTVVLHC